MGECPRCGMSDGQHCRDQECEEIFALEVKLQAAEAEVTTYKQILHEVDQHHHNAIAFLLRGKVGPTEAPFCPICDAIDGESRGTNENLRAERDTLQAEVADLKAGRVVSFARIKILETQMANLGVEYAAQVKDQAERIEWMETNLQAILETAIEDGPVTTDWLVDRCNEALAWDDPHGECDVCGGGGVCFNSDGTRPKCPACHPASPALAEAAREVLAYRETAKEANRVHIEMHNQITALQAEVARLKSEKEKSSELWLAQTATLGDASSRIAELEAKPDYPADIDLIKRTATEAALRWAFDEYARSGYTRLGPGFFDRGLAALLGEGE